MTSGILISHPKRTVCHLNIPGIYSNKLSIQSLTYILCQITKQKHKICRPIYSERWSYCAERSVTLWLTTPQTPLVLNASKCIQVFMLTAVWNIHSLQKKGYKIFWFPQYLPLEDARTKKDRQLISRTSTSLLDCHPFWSRLWCHPFD